MAKVHFSIFELSGKYHQNFEFSSIFTKLHWDIFSKVPWYYIEFTWAHKPYVANDNKKALKKAMMAKMKSGYNNYHDLVCVQHDLSIFLPLPPCRNDVARIKIVRGPDQ